MLDTVAISLVVLGGLLLITGLFIVLIDVIVEVLTGKEGAFSFKVQRFIIAGVLIGVLFVMLGCVLHGVDAALKLS